MDIVKAMCKGEKKLLRRIAKAVTREPGAPAGNKNASKTKPDNVRGCSEGKEPERGTSECYSLWWLGEHRKDLLERVKAVTARAIRAWSTQRSGGIVRAVLVGELRYL